MTLLPRTKRSTFREPNVQRCTQASRPSAGPPSFSQTQPFSAARDGASFGAGAAAAASGSSRKGAASRVRFMMASSSTRDGNRRGLAADPPRAIAAAVKIVDDAFGIARRRCLFALHLDLAPADAKWVVAVGLAVEREPYPIRAVFGEHARGFEIARTVAALGAEQDIELVPLRCDAQLAAVAAEHLAVAHARELGGVGHFLLLRSR